jgi:tRNA-2-methylthio-N6-dimethylallyladenosine synthase
MPSVFFQTFGCQMNVADSGDVARELYRREFHPTDDPAEADLIVVNTCSVREHAEQRARARIAEFGRMKKRSARLWVIGCMAERLGDDLKTDLPCVDRVIGAKSIDRIGELVASALPVKSNDIEPFPVKSEASDFVSIMRGCDNYCAYCIVPYVRGPETSIPVASILDTVRRKAAGGVREVTLLGQNVNSYLVEGVDFPDLLRLVAAIDGIDRVRFTTSHPKDCGEKLVRTMAEVPECCRHIHLPVQSGSDRILELMNRRYTAREYCERIAMIRSLLPDADITTDILVGFPSESDAEFEATLALAEEVRFTTAFMFAYSVRGGTAAARIDDSVPKAVKLERLKKLVDLQTAITKSVYGAMVGKRVRLMLAGLQEKGEGRWMARDHGCKRALIACDHAKAGTILEATVERSSGMTLICGRENV